MEKSHDSILSQEDLKNDEIFNENLNHNNSKGSLKKSQFAAIRNVNNNTFISNNMSQQSEAQSPTIMPRNIYSDLN